MTKHINETFRITFLLEGFAKREWQQIIIVLVVGGSYVLAFAPLYDLAGPEAAIVSILPIIVVAWLFGLKGGLIASLVSQPLNMVLVISVGGDVSWWLKPGGWLSYLGLVVIGAVIGRMADLRIALKEEIQHHQRTQERVSQLTFFDALTGLPNQTLFMDRLNYALARSQRHSGLLYAVILLDLDNFKAINESLGPMVGDQVLVKVAQRLRNCVRSVDAIARLWGDEFAILLDEIEDVSDALRIAQRAQDQLAHPMMAGSSWRGQY